jgi:hypothetical protein
VDHSEGKGGERAVAILRFQGVSPTCVDYGPHHFSPDGQASICTDRMLGLWGPVNLVAQ